MGDLTTDPTNSTLAGLYNLTILDAVLRRRGYQRCRAGSSVGGPGGSARYARRSGGIARGHGDVCWTVGDGASAAGAEEDPSRSRVGDERDLVVLDDIDLDVTEGEFVTLIGPSGCGKSTLLNIIVGLDTYDSGEVIANGKNVRSSGPDIVMIFQEDALFPWLSVAGNVEFGLREKRIPRGERRKIAAGTSKWWVWRASPTPTCTSCRAA